MSIPNVGDRIIFVKKPWGSCMREDEIYEVEYVESPKFPYGCIGFRHINTRLSHCEPIGRVDRARWYAAGGEGYDYKADRIRMEKQLDERNARNAEPPSNVIPFPNAAARGMRRPTTMLRHIDDEPLPCA